MIRIVAEKIKKYPYYKIIFDNIPEDSESQLSLIVKILEGRELDRVKDGILPEYDSEWLNIIHGEYYDDYYIAFYDPILDTYWEAICEKKYGKKGFVYDQETPMLRLSKENFEQLVQFWNTVKDYEPEYYIITQNESGWVDVQAKQELSEEEKQMVEKAK